MTTAICSLALWALVQTTCAEYDLPPQPVYELILAESGGDPLAIGDDGDAIGLCQFHEGTFTWAAERYDVDATWPEGAKDAETSVRLMCAVMADGRAALWHGWSDVNPDVIPSADHSIWARATDRQRELAGIE